MANCNIKAMIVLLVVLMMVREVFADQPTQNMVEGFSRSGMNMSDRYCSYLASGYYKPWDQDPNRRSNYYDRICSKLHRNVVDHGTGNYYMIGDLYI